MSERRMPFVPALQTIAELRRDEIVVTTMGAAREWPRLSSSPLDFHYLPSAMGHAPALALGMAIAQPQREVIVLCGDGGMLMGMSVLVTIIAAEIQNLTVVVFENGIYEVTGGQPTAAGAIGVDFAGLARASGFARAESFDTLATWQERAAASLRGAGPRFICLRVEPVGAAYQLPPPISMPVQIAAFGRALGLKS